MGCSSSHVQNGDATPDPGARPVAIGKAHGASATAPERKPVSAARNQAVAPASRAQENISIARRLSLSGAVIPPSQMDESQPNAIRLDHGIRINPESVLNGATKPTWPITFSLLENDLLTVTVYHHEMESMVSGSFWCWTYVTKGLSVLGQKEMVFTLKRRTASEREQDFKTDIIEWFTNIYSLAQSDALVDEWGQSRFYRQGFLDREDIRLFLYSPPIGIRALPAGALPDERLHIIPATAPEADVVHYYCTSRFISQLGKSERWFPVHPWFDRDRQHCVTPEQMTGTIRSMFSFTTVGGVSVMKRGSDLVVHVPHKSIYHLQSAVSANDPSIVFGLDSYPYNGSDSGMTWTNQDTTPMAYGTGSTCMSLGFLVFCPDQDQDDCMMREDGYILLLTRSTWVGIMNAIKFSMPMQFMFNNIRFCLEYGLPESKLPEKTVQTTQDHRTSVLAAVPQHSHQLPSAECVLSKKTGDKDFWIAQKHDPTHDTARDGPVELTLGDLEDDEEKSCDKCIILARGIRSYVPSGSKSLRLQFFHRGGKLCCTVEGESDKELILEITSDDDAKCPWLLPPVPAETSSRSLSDNSVKQALKWYMDCQKGHGCCRPAQPPHLPIRVLDLGVADKCENTVCLVEAQSVAGQYGTISHCWPSGETVTTTNGTLESHKLGIKMRGLPKSFQNAILLFRALGVRYVWVDSLCIIQDNEEDWQAQSAQIDSIFANSSITIAVADDGSCTPGCFLSEPPTLRSRLIRWPGINEEGSYLTTVGHSSEHTPLMRKRKGSPEAPYAEENWVHPERQGAKRILYVGKTELIWGCKAYTTCECGFQG